MEERLHLPAVPVQVLRHHLRARVHDTGHLDGPADHHRHLLFFFVLGVGCGSAQVGIGVGSLVGGWSEEERGAFLRVLDC